MNCSSCLPGGTDLHPKDVQRTYRSKDLYMQISVLQETYLKAKIHLNFVELKGAYNIDQCPGEITMHGFTLVNLIKVRKYTSRDINIVKVNRA